MRHVENLKSFFSRLFDQKFLHSNMLRVNARRRSRRSAWRTQTLEDRALLAVFTVTTTADSGPGSLRDAMTQANVDTAADTIEFNIPGAGPHTIQPLTPLPAFASRILVDGFSQPSFAGTPQIFLDGSIAGGSALRLPRAGNWPAGSEIRGLAIGNWSGVAIDIQTSGVVVVSNYIGTDASGQTGAPNGGGISLFFGGANNRIGTDGNGIGDETEGNVISGNTGDGIRFTTFPHGHVTGTVVAGNKIGVAADGFTQLGNGGHGIHLRGSRQTQIGGDLPVERNIISGNTGYGVAVVADNHAAVQTNVTGNYIGTDATGTIAVPNQTGGVLVGSGALNTTIGVPGSRNLISGNNGQGISINSVDGVTIQSNWIGLDVTGTTTLPNELNGVSIPANSTNITIGTNSDGVDDDLEGNVISGNFNGINQFRGSSVVAGNKIGTDPTGLVDLGNQRTGVVVNGGDIKIGMPGAAGRNIISGNGAPGIEVGGEADVTIQNNYVGLASDGSTSLQNDGAGIRIDAATANITVGTNGDGISDEFEGNVISGNRNHGIELEGGIAVIAGNLIGLDAHGLAPASNGQDGIHVQELSLTTTLLIGTNADGISDSAERNVIAGNNQDQIEIGDGGNVIIAGNYVGTDITGTSGFDSNTFGINVNGSGNRRIGGASSTERNVVGGLGTGIVAQATNASYPTFVYGNYVGVDPTGRTAVPNVVGINSNGNVFVGTNGDGIDDQFEGNVVSGNKDSGIQAQAGSVVAGNIIGLTANGTEALGNTAEGIAASSDTGQVYTVRIGTNGDGIGDEFEGNLVGWNGRGISLSTGNFSVKGNLVGIDGSGNPAPNSGDGIAIRTHRLGTVELGSNEEFAGNIIQYNARYGVSASGTFSNTTPTFNGSNNIISGNLLGSFTRPVLNSPQRGEFNYPVVSSMTIVGDEIIVEGFARPGQTIDIYESGPTSDGFGEGRRKLLSFVEGSADDLDSFINDYGPIVNGVEVGEDEGFQFRFVAPVPDGLAEGMLLSTIGQSSPLDAAADRMSLFSPSFLFGELGSSLAPTIEPIPDVVLAPGDTLLQRGSFVDPDSISWTATVNYGDGTGVRALQLLDDFQFDLDHEYTTPGTYTVTVNITDNSLLTGLQTFTVTVENDTPEAAFYTFDLTSPIVEGDTATLTGEFSDALSSGSYFVDIDWGNGQTSTIPLGSSDRQFTGTHVYRDDFNSSGSATAADVYEVSVTIREVGGNNDPTPAGVLLIEVQNSVPNILSSNFSSTSVNEGDTVTLDLDFEDLGLDDSHEIKLDWGDGTVQIITPAVGVRSLNNLSHAYLNTPRNGDPDYIVSIELTDDDEPLNPVLLTQAITVTSPAPTDVVVNNETGLSSIDEGGSLTIGGSFTDLGSLDSHLVIIDWGDGRGQTSFDLPAGVTSFSGITHQYVDDPATGTEYSIIVRVADTDNRDLFGTGILNVVVNNVAPELGTPQFDTTNALEGDTVLLTGSYLDVGLDDRHTVIVTWADGTQSEAAIDSTARTYQAAHTYRDNAALPNAIYNVSVTLTDDGGLADTQTIDLQVSNVAPHVEFLSAPDQNNADAVELWSNIFDPGLDDTFTYEWEAIATGQPNQTGDLPTFTLDRSAAPNAVFLVTLTVTDKDGGIGSYSLEVQVGTSNADSILLNNTSFIGGTDSVLILGLGGDDFIDASAVTDPSINLILDGGSGQDILYGGSGDDIFILANGDDAANAVPFGGNIVAISTPNTAGNDRYILTPNSVLTVFDDQGGNTLDFERSSFGITYDLEAVSSATMASQDVAPGGAEPNTHFVAAQGSFAGLVGSTFGDDLTAAANSTVSSGAGNDTLRVKSNTAGATFNAGADDDVLMVSGTGISSLNFGGDDGLDSLINSGSIAGLTFGGGADDDLLINNGSIAGLTFGGGADDDILQNVGTITATLNFGGDDGLDVLTNTGSISELIFRGGADDDIFFNNGATPTTLNFGGDEDILLSGVGTVGTLNFGGDDGADIFANLSSITTLTFNGGADDDIFVNNGATISSLNFGGDDVLLSGQGSIGTLNFGGDDGADTLLNLGTMTSLTFNGGADDDILRNAGSVTTTLNFGGDDGLDALLNTGTIADLTFNGGADDDIFLNNGSNSTTLNFGGDEEILLAGVGSVGSLNFGGDDGADVLVNLSQIDSLTFGGGADDDVLINNGPGATTLSFGGDEDIFLNGTGVVGTLNFGGDDGFDTLMNYGTVTTLTFDGGADDDVLINTASDIATLNFGGDDGSDTLINSGLNVGTLNFGGDDGLDVLSNSGTIASLLFTGGADDDVLQNTGTISTTLNFGGDDGFDVLSNSGTIAALTFDGGADDDVLLNSGTISTTLNFGGDDGADNLLNRGTIASLIFTGGADDDVLINRAGTITTLNFGGDDGADVLFNSASITTLTFSGGADDDVLQNVAGNIGSLNFGGDDGSDLLVNRGVVTSLTFTGGADNDRLLNAQDSVSTLRFYGGGSTTNPLADPAADGDDLFMNTGSLIGLIEFDGGVGGDVFQNSGHQITTLTITGGDGDDAVVNSGNDIDIISFNAGGGNDVFQNSGERVRAISYTGDGESETGDDILVLRGSGTGAVDSTIQFLGRAGGDVLHNHSFSYASILFDGGSENDVFVNGSNGVSNLTFLGGAGDDIFENKGLGLATVLFDAGSGVDLVVNTGDDVTGVHYIGGIGDDLLVNLGNRLAGLTFTGNEDADRFENFGQSVADVTFDAGDGLNVFRNQGAGLARFHLMGGDDADTLLNLTGGTNSNDITLTGAGGDDRFLNAADGVTDILFGGGDGDDGFQNNGSGVVGITVLGGGGNDVVINDGDDVSVLQFEGEAGNDAFQNSGKRLTSSVILGGVGDETFVMDGDAATEVTLSGDDGRDSLFIKGSNLGSITFNGGEGDDSFESYAIQATQLTVNGNAGDDDVRSHGFVESLNVNGGADNDILTNTAKLTGAITFIGEDGNDTLISRGGQATSISADLGTGKNGARIADASVESVAITSLDGQDSVEVYASGQSLSIDVGSGRDFVAVMGDFDTVDVNAGDNNDNLLLAGAGAITASGGAGDDTYVFVGDQLTSVAVIEAFESGSDSSSDTLDFSAFSGGALNLDLSLTTPQAFGGMAFQLSDGLGIENVIGTRHADTINGNARDNFLSGADYTAEFDVAEAARRTEAQWVLLDFDTYTDPGEHVYTALEQQNILNRLSEIYHGPDAGNPWFDVFFTTNAADISTAEHVTIFINETPESGRPGGLASEIDFGNMNPGGTAVVQINGLLGGIVSRLDAIPVDDHASHGSHSDTETQQQLLATDPVGSAKPAGSSANFVQLTSKIIAHELGHLLGLRHQDAFGPIGFGVNIATGSDGFKPEYTGPVSALETFDHISSSPASVGSTRFDDLQDLFFGEREVIKLVAGMSEPGDIHTTEISETKGDIASAQPVEFSRLNLPNTLTRGINAGDSFSAIYQTVSGTIELVSDGEGGEISEGDFYQFSAHAGDVFTLELMSNSISAYGNQPDDFVDSILKVYDSSGQLLPYYGGLAVNDDTFEPTDSALFDLLIPADGVYYVEVDTFRRPDGDPLGDPANPVSPLNPNNPNNILGRPEVLQRFLDSLNDADIGRYQLIMYGFRDATANDGTNVILGNGGTDIILGGSESDVTAPVSEVQSLPQQATSLTFDITVDGYDPETSDGQVSGVASYHIYVAVDNGGFEFWQTVSAGNPVATFTAESNHTYWFRSVGEDNAGNLEDEPIGPDTHIFVGDLNKPETAVTEVSAADSGLIEVTAIGTDFGGGTLLTVQFYVSIDGGAPQLVGESPTSDRGDGTRIAVMTYQGIVDGQEHTYAFYSVGIDSRQNVEDAPATADFVLTRTFNEPAGLQATGIDVQKGANQRSFIRYLDITFSDGAGLQNLLDNNRLRLERFDLDAASVAVGTGVVLPTGAASVSGQSIALDFGAQGIGGDRRSATGNGFYRISIDSDEDGSWDDQHFEFFRIFGDADGSGVVDSLDQAVVNSQYGRRGANLDGDIDGDKRVSVSDRLFATRNVGVRLKEDLFDYLDD